ncbi:MAG: hypothetical protein ACM3QU_14960 [Verrucomicrobiota bacterium]
MLIPAEYDGTTGPPKKQHLALGIAAAAIAGGVLVAVVAVARDGGSAAKQPTDDPAVFLRGIVTRIAANDYDTVWQRLHPAQQRVATRAVYVRCEELTPIPGHLDWIRVVSAKDERINVPGDTGMVDSKAVTFRLELSEPVLKQSVVVTKTVHAVAVDGRWRWILTPERFGIYRARSCPGAPAPPTGA